MGDLTLKGQHFYSDAAKIISFGKVYHKGFEFRQRFGSTIDALDDIDFDTSYVLNISTAIRSGNKIRKDKEELTDGFGGYFSRSMNQQQFKQYIKKRGFKEDLRSLKQYEMNNGEFDFAYGNWPSILQSAESIQLNFGDFVITNDVSTGSFTIKG